MAKDPFEYFSDIGTLGACSELMDSVHDLAKRAFILDLPGISHEEQKALYDMFEDLRDARIELVNRATEYAERMYAERMYAVTKKEAEE